jgi:muconolactone delta-isomerase
MLIADIYRYKDSTYAIPPEKLKEITPASTAFIQKYAKSGNWKANFSFANGRGGIAIWDFASGEEMSRILRESPVWGYLDSEIIPLSETNSIADAIMQAGKTPSKSTRK